MSTSLRSKQVFANSVNMGFLYILLAFFMVPPGYIAIIIPGLSVFGLSLFLVLILLAMVVTSGRLKRIDNTYPFLFLLLLTAYLVYPKYGDVFSVGSRGRETIAILVLSFVVSVLGQQLVLLASRPFRLASWLRRSVIIAGVLTAIIILLEDWGIIDDIDGAMAYAGFGSRVHAGIYTAFVMFLALIELKFLKGERWLLARLILMIFIAFLAFASVMSLSRNAWGVLLLAFIVFYYHRRSWVGLIRLMIIPVLLYSVILLYAPASQRLETEDFTTGRMVLWLQLLPSTFDELVIGRGVGYMWSLTGYDINKYGGYSSEFNESIYAHNDYLFLVAELGLLGLIIWLFIIYRALKLGHELMSAKYAAVPIIQEQGRLLLFLGLMIAFVSAFDTLIFGLRNFMLVIFFASVSIGLARRLLGSNC